MTRSPFFLVILLAAAIGVPYFLYSDKPAFRVPDVTNLFQTKKADGSSPENSNATVGDVSGTASAGGPLAPAAMYTPLEPQLEGLPIADFAEVIRFDVTPAWVMSRWSRVSLVAGDPDLEGMRVPLVTGKRSDDLAGSLSYYFDKHQKVQRITFEGVTGDDRRLVAYVTSTYKLKAEPTLGAGLYLTKSWGKYKNALRISLPPVVRTESLHSKLAVLLELNESRSSLALSPQFQAVLDDDKQTRRW